jgi:hypothetical protein
MPDVDDDAFAMQGFPRAKDVIFGGHNFLRSVIDDSKAFWGLHSGYVFV